MALQNLLWIAELDGFGEVTGEMRSLKSTDDLTIVAATSTFTNGVDFDGGLTLAAGTAIAGDGALSVETGTGDLTLKSTDGNIIAQLGDASGVKKLLVRDSGGTGSVFSIDSDGNVVLNGNLTVAGTVAFSSGATAITPTNQVTDDPILLLSASQTGAAAYDLGFIGERGDDQNVGLIWDESADLFAAILTDSTATETGNLTIASYADFKAKDLYAARLLATGADAIVKSVGGGVLLKMGAGGGASKVSFQHNDTEMASVDSAGKATFPSLVINGSTAITSIDTDLSAVSGSDDTLASAKAIKSYVDTAVAGAGGASILNDLTDVTLAGLADNDFLIYDSASGEWGNVAAADIAALIGMGTTDSPSFAGLFVNGDTVLAASAEVIVDGYAVASSNAAGNNLLFVMVAEGAGSDQMKARLPNVASGGSFALARINGVWRTGSKAVRQGHCESILVEDDVDVAINDPIYASTTTAGRVTVPGATGMPGAGAFKVLVGYAKSKVTGGTNQVVKVDLLIQPPVQL